MNVYELEQKIRKTEPHYFDRDTLKFFGERFSEMRILGAKVPVTDSLGVVHPSCVVLSKLSRSYPGGARRTYDYFDTATWERVIPQTR